jgi:uncharacterized protein (DUF3820 family)
VNNKHELVQLAEAKMPFGKYQGRFLIHLPEHYIVWFKQNGFPTGKLGKQMELIYEIKLNGLEHLIIPLVPKNQW